MKGFITYPTYTVSDNKTIIQLFGRLENGESFVTLHPFSPYFFIRTEDLKKIPRNLKLTKEKTKLTNFKKEPLTKILSSTNAELTKIQKEIRKQIETYEADLRPHYQFLIENNILGSIQIEGHHESQDRVDRVYSSPEISPTTSNTKLKVASIDIETDKTMNKLFCIGIHSENYHKTFLITKDKNLKNVVPCKDEEEALEKFKSELIKLDPDIITGWNVIEFDLNYLKNLFKKHKIPFDIGRIPNIEPRLRLEQNFFRASTAIIPGRQVLDCLTLIKDPFIKEAPTIKKAKFESYTLEDVSQTILNKGKILKGNRSTQIEELYETNQQKLADYNLLDCQLVYEILEKTEIIPLSITRSKLTGLPLDRLTGSIAAFDSLYIREAHKKNLASPTLHYKKKEERIKGGYVSSLNPGIYNNVLVLDFKSLYPSIIRTFNIDPSSYLEKPNKNSITSPNKAHFTNQDGILPEILTRLHEARNKAKKENNELANHSIKVTMNSMFGVLASPNCRYFNLKMANAITHFGQEIIKLTAKEIEKKFKHPVIYSDTDSVFIHSQLPKEKANALGLKIQDHINNFYNNYVKKNYNRTSLLELEFEKQYLSLLIPKTRDKDSTKAAKKRYAGLVEKNNKESLEITGLEAIRGDWTEAAQDFQKELLNKVFHNQPLESFIKSYIKQIKEGKLDKKLIYKKSIRKALEEYTKTTPPHVKAARKLPALTSNIIKYVVTTDGPEPIEQIKHKIDYDHYIEKQIKPIANQILTLLDKDFEEIEKGSKQTKLF